MHVNDPYDLNLLCDQLTTMATVANHPISNDSKEMTLEQRYPVPDIIKEKLNSLLKQNNNNKHTEILLNHLYPGKSVIKDTANRIAQRIASKHFGATMRKIPPKE